MKKVTGIGGVFFKCTDPAATKKWYEQHLGIAAGPYGFTFEWQEGQDGQSGTTTWNPFKATTDYFGPGQQEFMINYRVANLVTLLEALRAGGVTIEGEMQEFEYGKFAWIVDCDGRRVELWEPIDQPIIDYEKASGNTSGAN